MGACGPCLHTSLSCSCKSNVHKPLLLPRQIFAYYRLQFHENTRPNLLLTKCLRLLAKRLRMDFSQLHVTTPSVKVTQGDVKVTRGDATGLWCRMVTSGGTPVQRLPGSIAQRWTDFTFRTQPWDKSRGSLRSRTEATCETQGILDVSPL